MSAYYFNSFNFELSDDIEPQEFDALVAVAANKQVSPTVLAKLHPVVRYFLSDWRRLVSAEESGPMHGSPVRVSHTNSRWDARGGLVPKLSIEWIQHDDVYANGGYMFEVWIRSLIRRPDPNVGGTIKRTVGWTAMYPNDYDARLVYVDERGIGTGDGPVSTFEEIRTFWAEDPVGPWELWLEEQLSGS